MRLLCFPFSGGSAMSYRGLGTSFGRVEVSTFELPGRGRRFSEALLHRFEPMVDDLFAQVRSELREPYAMYGHSMGAILAYLLARRLVDARLPQPVRLFVSGSRAPSMIRSEGWHLLSGQAFQSVLAKLGGCPPALLADAELMALYEPVLRADFEAMANYRYLAHATFRFPITALIGEDDSVSDAEATQWQRETSRPLQLERLSGDHFFIFRHWTHIQRLFSAQLEADDGDGSVAA